jgi:hypothetical protein
MISFPRSFCRFRPDIKAAIKYVIPAGAKRKAGIQKALQSVDSRLRGNDIWGKMSCIFNRHVNNTGNPANGELFAITSGMAIRKSFYFQTVSAAAESFRDEGADGTRAYFGFAFLMY